MNIENLLSYHKPTPEATEKYQTLRQAAINYAKVVEQLVPPSAEQTLAIRAIHLSLMHANSAVVIHETEAIENA